METSDQKIEELKYLLLDEDRIEINALREEIAHLKTIIKDKKLLDKEVGPIISEHLNQYTKDIPKNLGKSITKTLKLEIENSQDKIVDILYPIMGKLIKKYIQKEFEKLSEQINKKLKRRFSFGGIKRKIKSIFTGVKEEDIVVEELSETKIEELFIIEKNSGLLKGNYSTTNTIDKDVLSGMLTAIKSFVEDALKTGNDDLETIEYGLYNIHIQNFNTYYIASVIHGVFDISFKEDLREQLFEFSQKHYTASKSKKELSEALKKMFN